MENQNTADLAAMSFVKTVETGLQKSSEQIEKLASAMLADQEARKQEAELKKSEIEAQAELKKSEFATKSEELEKENKMLKSVINIILFFSLFIVVSFFTLIFSNGH